MCMVHGVVDGEDHVEKCCRPCWYGVALVSRIDKIIGLFCKRAL